MLHLDAGLVLHHILALENIQLRDMSRAGKLLGSNDEIDALDNHLVIFLLRTLSWYCQFEQNVFWRQHKLHVKIVSWRNKALLMENV